MGKKVAFHWGNRDFIDHGFYHMKDFLTDPQFSDPYFKGFFPVGLDLNKWERWNWVVQEWTASGTLHIANDTGGNFFIVIPNVVIPREDTFGNPITNEQQIQTVRVADFNGTRATDGLFHNYNLSSTFAGFFAEVAILRPNREFPFQFTYNGVDTSGASNILYPILEFSVYLSGDIFPNRRFVSTSMYDSPGPPSLTTDSGFSIDVDGEAVELFTRPPITVVSCNVSFTPTLFYAYSTVDGLPVWDTVTGDRIAGRFG